MNACVSITAINYNALTSASSSDNLILQYSNRSCKASTYIDICIILLNIYVYRHIHIYIPHQKLLLFISDRYTCIHIIPYVLTSASSSDNSILQYSNKSCKASTFRSANSSSSCGNDLQ
jgi:hypothetical protein